MANNTIPPSSQLVDSQFIQVQGPDGIITGFQYDAQTKTLFTKESQIIIPSFHGMSHIAEDPVPNATTDTPGLMSSDDKAKLDQLLQMRIGVLGFAGAGFSDDGGFLQGDIILASGSEFISIERVGNVVRFTVDNPVPLNCGCEECANIFWIQDESDIRAIRPPSCNGVLPDVNAYGELKIHLLPESTILDSSNPLPTLNQKGSFPALIFKRAENALTSGLGEIQIILARNSNATTNIGWAMTPGATGTPECVWFMGTDDNGNQIRFELLPQSEPNLLGALLYKGHTLTRQMAVITGYESTVLATNQYTVRKWSVDQAEPVGGSFAATNVWRYNNPENSTTSPVDPKQLVLDATVDLLPIGTLVQLWEFKIGEATDGTSITRSFFNLEPKVNADNLWGMGGVIRFGDLLEEREEVAPASPSAITAAADNISDVRLFERTVWGITGFEDPLLLSDDGTTQSGTVDTEGEPLDTGEPSGIPLNNRFVADIDPLLPGLRVTETVPNSDHERPVFIWHRGNHKNFLMKALVGRPDNSRFPPVDVLLRAPIDSFDDRFMKVIRRGMFDNGPFAGNWFIVVKGLGWHDLPPTGVVRTLTGPFRDEVWQYFFKTAFSPFDDDGITLVGMDEPFLFDEDAEATAETAPIDIDTSVLVPGNTTVAELLHTDYTSPALRLEFSVLDQPGSESVQLQFKGGILDMSDPYELNIGPDVSDDLVRGMRPGGFSVSRIFTQDGFIASTENPTSDPDGFVVYDGGELPVIVDGETERWNELMIMFRNGQLWVWWNNLLIPPDPAESSGLPVPVTVSTPYFPVETNLEVGKVGLRLWPGTKIREIEIRDQLSSFNEFVNGQLMIT